MVDLEHTWSGDLQVGYSGDLAVVTGSDMTTRRIYRRLMTNTGGYLWNLDYGAGLAQFVGQPYRSDQIESIVRNQMSLEASVAQTPPPTVTTAAPVGSGGYVLCTISFTDAASGSQAQFTVGPFA